MNNNKTTKRALGSSIVALLICCTMLIGTTYAWFTDSVTSSGNVIKSGTLDVALTWSDDYSASEDAWNDVEDENAPKIFDYALWEPGYTEVRYLKVANNGTLALKYKVQIIANGELADENGVRLSDVIDVYYASSKVEVPDRDLDANANLSYLGTLTQFITGSAAINDSLLAGEGDYATLVLQMKESAGNEYQNLSVGTTFDIMLFATQFTYEEDSFDDQYDVDAKFEGSTSTTVTPGDDAVITVYDTNDAKVAVFNIPAEAIADGVTEVTATILDSDETPNINIAAGSESKTVDITVSGLKEDNATEIKVELYIGKGYDPATVTVYHYDQAIAAGNEVYNPETGYVNFVTTDFSPFTIVYDADSANEIPDNNGPADLPPLSLVEAPQYVVGGAESDIAWENYSGWSPTEGLDAHLEAAYIFQSVHTPEEVEASPYRTWICDFYVKVTTDDGSNPFVNADGSKNYIFLGGNYGDFGWVGFHFTDDYAGTADEYVSGTEIPLLQSVAGGWTYEQIADLVGIFTCGVGDHADGLSGDTFTVSLRLVNPENEAEYYDVAVVDYKFN